MSWPYSVRPDIGVITTPHQTFDLGLHLWHWPWRWTLSLHKHSNGWTPLNALFPCYMRLIITQWLCFGLSIQQVHKKMTDQRLLLNLDQLTVYCCGLNIWNYFNLFMIGWKRCWRRTIVKKWNWVKLIEKDVLGEVWLFICTKGVVDTAQSTLKYFEIGIWHYFRSTVILCF